MEEIEYREDMTDEEKEQLCLKMIKNLELMLKIIENEEDIYRSYT